MIYMKTVIGCFLIFAAVSGFGQTEDMEMVVQMGHNEDVTTIAYAPNGKTALSGSADRTVRLWDVASGTELRVFPGHSFPISSVAFSPDGLKVISGANDLYETIEMKLWDLKSGNELVSFKRHTGSIEALAFAPDGTKIVLGSRDGTMRVWDSSNGNLLKSFNIGNSVNDIAFLSDGNRILIASEKITLWDIENGRVLYTFDAHSDDITSIAISPDGTQFLSGSSDTTIILWDLQLQKKIQTFAGHQDRISKVEFTSNPSEMVSSDKEQLIVWNLQTGDKVQTYETLETNAVAFSPDGTNALVSERFRNTIHKIDLTQRTILYTFRGHEADVNCVDFSPDGTQLLSGSWDTTMKLWNVVDGSLVKTFRGHTGRVYTLTFSSNGLQALSGSLDGTVILWDIAGGKAIRTFAGHTQRVYSVDFSPDGHTMVSASWDGTMKLWDLKSGEALRTFTGHTAAVNSVTFTPDGNKIVTGSSDKTVRVWDIATGKIDNSFSVQRDEVYAVAVSPDGDKILAATSDGVIILWSLTNYEELMVCGERDGVYALAFAPDGESFFSSSNNGRLVLWETMGDRQRIFRQSYFARGIAFSPDGKTIASGTSDGTIVLRDLRGGAILTTYGGHSNDIKSVDFAPDGTEFACGLENNSIAIWNLQKLEKPVVLSGHKGFPLALAFSPDGGNLLSGAYHMHYWDLADSTIKQKFFHSHSSFGYSAIHDVVFTPDGNRAVSVAPPSGTIKTWDVNSGQELQALDGHLSGVESVAISPDGLRLLSGSIDNTMMLWDLESGTPLQTFDLPGSVGDVVEWVFFSPDGGNGLGATYGKPSTISYFNLVNGVNIFNRENIYMSSLSLAPDANSILVGNSNSSLELLEIASGKQIATFPGHFGYITCTDFSPADNYFVSGSRDNTARVWNLTDGEWVAFMQNADNEEWLIFDSDGYWDASPNGGRMVAMVRGMECWNIDQFAVRNNRPDLILKKLPDPDPELIEHYRNQYLRRLRRLGLAEEELSGDYHVPSADIVESSREGKYIDLRFVLEDRKVALKSYNIYVNDVPIFGAYGRDPGEEAAAGSTPQRMIEITERVELSTGKNKIEVSCMNEAGAEAFRPVVYADYDGAVKRKLYYIGFGVSEYRDGSLDLMYAHKDAVDLGELFGSIQGEYDQVVTKIYTDEEVTRENIASVKEIIGNASVDDTVVLFISGHGVHDRDEYATYYYLTHGTDIKNLFQTAVPFEELEDLLQGIPPRRKLFLMDTCGSGEWDPEMVQKVASADNKAEGKGVWSRMPTLSEESENNGTGTDRGVSRLLAEGRTYLAEKTRYIYNDLVRRSGAIVFSSCRGDEVSYENRRFENGLFTEYLLRALESGEERNGNARRRGDADGDGIVTVKELREFVESGVVKETKDDHLLYATSQTPTVDRDNIYIEFGF